MATKLNGKSLHNLCQVNKKTSEICYDPQFWLLNIERDFGQQYKLYAIENKLTYPDVKLKFLKDRGLNFYGSNIELNQFQLALKYDYPLTEFEVTVMLDEFPFLYSELDDDKYGSLKLMYALVRGDRSEIYGLIKGGIKLGGVLAGFLNSINREVVKSIHLESEHAERVLIELNKYRDILSQFQQHDSTFAGYNPFGGIRNPKPIYSLLKQYDIELPAKNFGPETN